VLATTALLIGCTLPVPAREFETYGPFVVQSDSKGQLSSAIYTIVVRTDGVLKVNYLAPRAHCSSLKMHFLLDGVLRTVSDAVSPGHATGYLDLGPAAHGVRHTLSLTDKDVPRQAWEIFNATLSIWLKAAQ
jgi:hypothetical protein